ncbi:MAG TPA: ergothioneine biosynthesis protein EgtB [Cyclobacteriaceae bacterium]|nr:ergothioneine biosynthesis protein EgtB [Cyclobacteriaceae bacterium]
MTPLLTKYKDVRSQTRDICRPLKTEDYVVQPVADVSPPKWHLGHTTWFFEAMILKPFLQGYIPFNPDFDFVFNSYYESLGARVIRTQRGNLSRPSVDEVNHYRDHVDQAMEMLLVQEVNEQVATLVTLGCHHEQQHQELLWTDIKFILGHNPLFPAYEENFIGKTELPEHPTPVIEVKGGVYPIGFSGDGFCFDNELERHKVYLQDFSISGALVTNEEFLEFIDDDGYLNFAHWHAEGWDWVRNNSVSAPLYWHKIDNRWFHYTLGGLKPLRRDAALGHVSYYEASAFAAWKGKRLPTEFEWEVSSEHFRWGERWEWTESAYLPYPGFKRSPGAIGEYNGKFMVNQKVLRGASLFTPSGHSRNTYRNFFHPHLRWQLTGIRLAQ